MEAPDCARSAGASLSMQKDTTMKRLIFSIAIAAFAAGCDRPATSGTQTNNDKTAANAPADNTDKNERDRNMDTLTPGDQGGSEADRTVTQHIRQGVVKDDGLSITSKNVKIITVNGVVTLRGPVKTSTEKSQIAAIAQSVDGVKRVDNQLEVATN
jgi:hyperosmotically inducible periplasmic protein